MSEEQPFNEEPAQRQLACVESPAIPDGCRAARIGLITEFAQCLAEPRPSCACHFVFGACDYCEHPQREAIIARTVAAEGRSSD
jgi:hypothetical protein